MINATHHTKFYEPSQRAPGPSRPQSKETTAPQATAPARKARDGDVMHPRGLRPSRTAAAHIHGATPLMGPRLDPPRSGRGLGANTQRWRYTGGRPHLQDQIKQLSAWQAAGQNDRVWSQYMRLARSIPEIPFRARYLALDAAVALEDPTALRSVLDHIVCARTRDGRRVLRNLLVRSQQERAQAGQKLAVIVSALQHPGAIVLSNQDIRTVMHSLAGTRDIQVLEQGFLLLAAQGCPHVPYYRALMGQMYANNGRAVAQALLNRWLTGAIEVSPILRQGLSPHLLRQRVMAHLEEETLAIAQVESFV